MPVEQIHLFSGAYGARGASTSAPFITLQLPVTYLHGNRPPVSRCQFLARSRCCLPLARRKKQVPFKIKTDSSLILSPWGVFKLIQVQEYSYFTQESTLMGGPG